LAAHTAPQDEVAWAVLKPQVFAAIMDHYASGEPVVSDTATLAASDTAIHEDDDEAGDGRQGGAGFLGRHFIPGVEAVLQVQ
jgi:hypothetical protein